MSLLNFNISACVRAINKFSTCQYCVESCPVETIQFTNNLPSFVPNDCVSCGGCLASCPSSAYSLDDFSAIDFIFSFLEAKKSIVTCRENIPCLAALSVEEMLSLALLSSNELTFDKSQCASCEIAKTNFSIIEERVEEVNFLLEAIENDKALKFEYAPTFMENRSESSRRDFLSKANIKDLARVKNSFENSVESLDEELKSFLASVEDIQNIREKKVPDRRKLLVMAMKRAGVPSVYHNLDRDDISFISQKNLDIESCTNCQMCYRICPTGALSSNEYGAFIAFDAINCIKCNSCHEVCEPNSLTLRKVFNTEQLFKPQKEKLATFDVKRCDECGMPFIYRSGEVMCQRCKIEEEEAHSLWGIE